MRLANSLHLLLALHPQAGLVRVIGITVQETTIVTGTGIVDMTGTEKRIDILQDTSALIISAHFGLSIAD